MLIKDILYIFRTVFPEYLNQNKFSLIKSLHNRLLDKESLLKIETVNHEVSKITLKYFIIGMKFYKNSKSLELAKLLKVAALLEEKAIIASPFCADKNLSELLSLSPPRQFAACKILIRLSKRELLDEKSYLETLQTVSNSLEKGQVFAGHGRLTYFRNQKYAQYQLSKNRTNKQKVYSHFYIDQRTFPVGSGSYGQVQLAHTSLRNLPKPLTVKWFKGGYDEGLALAKHEHKYHQLLYPDHVSFAFSHQVTFVALCYDWFPGGRLGKERLEYGMIGSFNLEFRLQLVHMLFQELHVLHKNFRVHGDIAYDNIIFNPFNPSLLLTDFNLSAKPYTNRSHLFRKQTADRYLTDNMNSDCGSVKYSFPDDLYTVAIIIASFFPEIFDSLGVYGFYPKLFPSINRLTSQEQAVKDLILSIWHQNDPAKNRELRASMATTAMTLDYINMILADWDKLTPGLLKEIGDKSIYKKEVTVDDVIHGHLRPLMRR